MTPVASKNRIIFIDLIRAFAVLNMVQGHTIDVLLAAEYRSFDNWLYALWHTNRGLTAPIFLFTAGTVFTYLFRLQKVPFAQNPRVMRGLKRSLLLLFVAYILRYPTPTIVYWGFVTQQQLDIFFTVDVLHLISIGLASIVLLAWISEKLGGRDKTVFLTFTIMIIVAYYFTEKVNWLEYMHRGLAGYLSRSAGSFFPIFPFLAYLTAGAFLGSFLADKPNVFRQKKFTVYLAGIGSGLIILALLIDIVEQQLTGTSTLWTTSPALVVLRLGIVLIFNAVFTYISARLESIPRILILLGRNTLLIYVVHLMILYGSTWNPGITLLFKQAFGPALTIGCAFVMIGLMMLLVWLINKFNIKNKTLVT
ncbi:MAG: heparan-alpha-glucosaminide N-acetyltransferase domain-containing protein [Ignavibacteriaceae bacterium]|jgi:uncharacterized membrane protein|nr:heparan-alpha-glucosaminide N-acetyltransferase domain-containing protein [Ignavibacteriaceae bacterium]